MLFDIDLDKTVEDRYSEVIKHYTPRIESISKKIEEIYHEYLPKIPLFNTSLNILINFHKEKILYYDEIEYWSKIFNINFHKILILQLLYEMNSGCTSVVYKGVMYRTMDWPMEFLKELTYQGRFLKNGRVIYEGICWLGSVGLFTVKSPHYSISINYRRVKNVSLLTLINNYLNLVNMHFPVSYLVRHIVESEMDSDSAIDALKKYKIVCPVYYTINVFDRTPVVIQRDPIGFKTYNEEEKNQYTIQTNCDVDKLNDVQYMNHMNIMNSYERYMQINKILNRKESRSTVNNLLESFSEYPVMNEETIYFCVISKEEFVYNI